MKNITKTVLYLQMAAMLATTALAGPVAAGKEVPFRGCLQGVETDEVQFPTLFVAVSATGNATHLGRFTMDFVAEVDLLSGNGIGTARFVAANGDRLFTDVVGHGEATPDGFSVVEQCTITGGTGRFAGASGRFILDRLVSTVTGFTSGSFDGTIILDH